MPGSRGSRSTGYRQNEEPRGTSSNVLRALRAMTRPGVSANLHKASWALRHARRRAATELEGPSELVPVLRFFTAGFDRRLAWTRYPQWDFGPSACWNWWIGVARREPRPLITGSLVATTTEDA